MKLKSLIFAITFSFLFSNINLSANSSFDRVYIGGGIGHSYMGNMKADSFVIMTV